MAVLAAAWSIAAILAAAISVAAFVRIPSRARGQRALALTAVAAAIVIATALWYRA